MKVWQGSRDKNSCLLKSMLFTPSLLCFLTHPLPTFHQTILNHQTCCLRHVYNYLGSIYLQGVNNVNNMQKCVFCKTEIDSFIPKIKEGGRVSFCKKCLKNLEKEGFISVHRDKTVSLNESLFNIILRYKKPL